MIVRQGDVLFVRRGTRVRKYDGSPFKPTAVGLSPTFDGVVLKGEATGHAHVVLEGTVYVDESGTCRLVEASPETTLSHEDHGKDFLEVGKWDVIRQREYDPEGNRPVVD